jgi:hypothetical protein
MDAVEKPPKAEETPEIVEDGEMTEFCVSESLVETSVPSDPKDEDEESGGSSSEDELLMSAIPKQADLGTNGRRLSKKKPSSLTIHTKGVTDMKLGINRFECGLEPRGIVEAEEGEESILSVLLNQRTQSSKLTCRRERSLHCQN